MISTRVTRLTNLVPKRGFLSGPGVATIRFNRKSHFQTQISDVHHVQKENQIQTNLERQVCFQLASAIFYDLKIFSRQFLSYLQREKKKIFPP